jgi:hypothetical protein
MAPDPKPFWRVASEKGVRAPLARTCGPFCSRGDAPVIARKSDRRQALYRRYQSFVAPRHIPGAARGVIAVLLTASLAGCVLYDIKRSESLRRSRLRALRVGRCLSGAPAHARAGSLQRHKEGSPSAGVGAVRRNHKLPRGDPVAACGYTRGRRSRAGISDERVQLIRSDYFRRQ